MHTLAAHPRLNIGARTALAAAGLSLCGIGIYMMIQAGIGLQPWDTLCMGIAGKLGLQYGTASVMVAVCVVAVNLLLHEKIGIGTLFDALLLGKLVDLLSWLRLLPQPDTLWLQIPLLVGGLVMQSFGQAIYMRAGLGCGPRDALMVGVGKRLRRLPIGAVNAAVLLTVLVVGCLLGGPIGVGTIICAVGSGPIMQSVFRLVHFEPRSVHHEDLLDCAKILTGHAA